MWNFEWQIEDKLTFKNSRGQPNNNLNKSNLVQFQH